MLAAAGLGRAEPGVRELQRPAQPLRLRGAEAVHAEEGGRAELPHQRPGQLLQTQARGPGDPGGDRRHGADAGQRQAAPGPHGNKDLLHRAGAQSIRRHPAVAHSQHQHRALRRQQGPQLGRRLLDDTAVPLVQHADAGHFQRHIPPPGPLQPLPRDLHPRHGHAIVPGRGHPYPAGQGRAGGRRVQFIGHVCQTHGFPLFFCKFAAGGAVLAPPDRGSMGKIKLFETKIKKTLALVRQIWYHKVRCYR